MRSCFKFNRDHLLRRGLALILALPLFTSPAIALPGTATLSYRYNEEIKASVKLSERANSGLSSRPAISINQMQNVLMSLLFLNLTTVKPAIASKADLVLTDAVGKRIKANQRPEIADLLALYNLRMKEKRYLAALSCISFITYLHSFVKEEKTPGPINDSAMLKTRLLAGRELLDRAEKETKAFDANAVLHLKLAQSLLKASGDAKLIARVEQDILKAKTLTKPGGYAGFLMIGNLVNGTIQYSPASLCKTIKEGDLITSVDGVETAGLNSQAISRLLDGTDPSLAKVKLERKGHKIKTTFNRGAPLPDTVPDNLSAQQYLELGSQLREVCRFEEGKQALRLAEEKDSGGAIAERASKIRLARFPLTDPTRPALLLYSSAYWLHQDKNDSAEKILKQCITAWPAFELPYRQLASVYRSSGRLPLAKETLENLLKVNPNYARGWNDLSQVKMLMSDSTGALIDAKRAVDLDPDDAFVHEWFTEITVESPDKKSK